MDLQFPSKSGASKRDLKQQVAKTRGADSEADEPWVPEEGARLWTLYWRVRRSGPLSYSELEAFQRVTGNGVEHWEAEIVMKMDSAVEHKLSELRSKR